MTPRELIAEAWHITRKHRRILLPWGALDALILMIWAIGFVSYQAYVLSTFFTTGENPSWLSTFQVIGEVLGNSPALSITFFTLAIIYGIFWIVIPRFAVGALIGLAAKIHTGDEPKGGLVLGVFNFFPLLELAVALGLISGKALLAAWSVIIRYMGGTAALFGTTALLLIFWAISFFFHFLFTFAEEAIVIRKLGVFRSLGHSFKLVLSYLKKVVLIFVLLLVIILRIVINALIILLIPSIVMGVGLLLAQVLPSAVSFGISGGIGLIALLFACYFLGYITVFKHTVWTITYIELSKERELDLIDAPSAEETKKETSEEAVTDTTKEAVEQEQTDN